MVLGWKFVDFNGLASTKGFNIAPLMAGSLRCLKTEAEISCIGAAVAMSLLSTMQEILWCGTSNARYLMLCSELEAVEGCKDEWLPEKSLHPLLV